MAKSTDLRSRMFRFSHDLLHPLRHRLFSITVGLVGCRIMIPWVGAVNSGDPFKDLIQVSAIFFLFYQSGVHISNGMYALIELYKIARDRLGEDHDLE